MKRGSVFVGLAALGTLTASVRDARADVPFEITVQSNTASITIMGGVVQDAGDPPYTYQLEVFLTGTIDPTLGTSVSLLQLTGVDSASLPSTTIVDQYGMAPGVSWAASINDTTYGTGTDPSQASYYNASDVTWTFSGSSSITGSNLLLGIFEVTTSVGLPAGYPSFLLTADISAILDGISGGGQIALDPPGTAPEPSTAIAPLCAIAGVTVVWLVKRRKQIGQRAAA
jgi:hypothetical protein